MPSPFEDEFLKRNSKSGEKNAQSEKIPKDEKEKSQVQKDLNFIDAVILVLPLKINKSAIMALLAMTLLVGGLKVLADHQPGHHKLVLQQNPNIQDPNVLQQIQAQIEQDPDKLVDLILLVREGKIVGLDPRRFLNVSYHDSEGDHQTSVGVDRVIQDDFEGREKVSLLPAIVKISNASERYAHLAIPIKHYDVVLPPSYLDTVNQKTQAKLDFSKITHIDIFTSSSTQEDTDGKKVVIIEKNYIFEQDQEEAAFVKILTYPFSEESSASLPSSETLSYSILRKNSSNPNDPYLMDVEGDLSSDAEMKALLDGISDVIESGGK